MSTLDIVPYQRRYRQPVLDLLFRSTKVHTHLDWHSTDQWIDTFGPIVFVALHKDTVVGVMGASEPLNQMAWLRIIAFDNDVDIAHVLQLLWQAMHAELKRLHVHTLAVLLIEDWLQPHVEKLGFGYIEDVVTLSRSGQQPPQGKNDSVVIRMATIDDLPNLYAVDQAAFTPPWQMTIDEIRYAKRMASSCTIAALSRNQIVGYQISTLYYRNGHLARLAVLPDIQRQGVGSSLLNDLIWRFLRRNIQTITVNTQQSNGRSQRLYQSHGFRHNGYDLQVWMANL